MWIRGLGLRVLWGLGFNNLHMDWLVAGLYGFDGVLIIRDLSGFRLLRD